MLFGKFPNFLKNFLLASSSLTKSIYATSTRNTIFFVVSLAASLAKSNTLSQSSSLKLYPVGLFPGEFIII